MPTRYTNAAVRKFGSFGYQPVLGFVEPDPGLGFDGKRILGAALASHWIYGGFRSLDGSKYFTWMKHYTNQGALSCQIYEADVDEFAGDQDLKYRRDSKNMYRGGCYSGERDGKWGSWDCIEGVEPRFQVLADTTSAHWIEHGVADIRGEVVMSTLQLAVADATDPLVYTSRVMRGTGTFLGYEVEGWWDMDTVHLRDGQDWLVTPYYHDLQGLWVFFTTEFEDGTIHRGTMFTGKEGFQGFAVERSDGDPIIAFKPDFEIQLDEEDYPIYAAVTVEDGEVWEWTRLPSGSAKMPTMNVAGGPRWIQGVVRQRGETRTVKSSDAFMETYRDRLDHALVP